MSAARISFVCASLFLLLFTGFAPLQGAHAEDEDLEERRKRLREAQTQFDKDEAAFVERVNAAIEKGSKWLASRQRKDGYWPSHKANTLDREYTGRAALNIFTLAKCGYTLKGGGKGKGKEKHIAKGLVALDAYQNWYRGAAANHANASADGHTYSKAMLVLMYDAIYSAKPKASKRKTRKPGASVAPGRKRKKRNPCKWPKDVAKKIRELVDWIVEHQETEIWRYPGPDPQNQDLSNAQYALLALQAAGRCGVKVDPEVYRKALKYMLAHQAKNGPNVKLYAANPAWSPGEDRYPRVIPLRAAKARGWGYMPGNSQTGSMTSAGIACLAIIKERLRDLGVLTVEERKQIDAAIRDGVGWFSRHFAVDKNPNNASWHYYYLYGLERAGDLLGIQYMGKHAWYREGAEYLLSSQNAKGSWPAPDHKQNAHGQTEMIRTCFALLFLKRATVPPSVPLGPVVTGD